MAELNQIIKYICSTYPSKNELSKARLNKIIYLSDWISSTERGKQISDIVWYFNHYGPYVNDIVNAAHNDECLDVIQTSNMYNDVKEIIKYTCEGESWESLSKEDIKVLDKVISETHQMYWNEFIKRVYSTYPVRTSSRFEKLDLVGIAKNKGQEKAIN